VKRQVAVALRYRQRTDLAPRVAARGYGPVAEKILRLAREFDVPIRRDEDLAGALARLDVGDFIPEELYAVIAEVLAWVYRLNSRTQRA